MPASVKSSRALPTIGCSLSSPTATKRGAASLQLTVGRVACATWQMEQEEASV